MELFQNDIQQLLRSRVLDPQREWTFHYPKIQHNPTKAAHNKYMIVICHGFENEAWLYSKYTAGLHHNHNDKLSYM